jgi:hypothetical protein
VYTRARPLCICSNNDVPPRKPLGKKIAGVELLHKTSISGPRRRYVPTCRFTTSPEVSPRDYVDTLNMGYPVVLCQGETPVAAHGHGTAGWPTRLRDGSHHMWHWAS